MKFVYKGKLTAGSYNDMEAGGPVFIDNNSLSDIVKELLEEKGFDADFCYAPFGKPEDVKNILIGKSVKLILEIDA